MAKKKYNAYEQKKLKLLQQLELVKNIKDD